MITTTTVHAAHADAWEVEGRARAAVGGGAARVRGARLMSSGLPDARWNNADLNAPDADLDAVARWYDVRAVPWGIRVPTRFAIEAGEPLFVKRCFGLRVGGSDDAGTRRRHGDLEVRPAASSERDRFIATEARLFGDDEALAQRWIGPVFGHPGFEHWFVARDGEPIGVVTAVASDGDAGPAVMLTGGVVDADEDPAILAVLLRRVIAAELVRRPGALIHVHADPDDDVALYRRLGFVEVESLEVRLMS